MASAGKLLSRALLRRSKRLSRKNLLPWLRTAMQAIPAGAEVLSIGAAGETAELARELALAHGWRLTLSDIDPEQGPEVIDDITASGFADARFDAVVICEVLEHVGDPFAAARELERILKPGGALIGSTPFIYPIHDRPYDHWRFTHYGLARLFSHFEGLEIRARNDWGEAVLVLQSRLVLEPGRAALIVAALLVPLAAPAAWLSRLVPSDFLTTGYVFTGRRIGD